MITQGTPSPSATGSKSAAPGAYLGFSLQPVRFCYYLLKSQSEDSVSLEYLDDVALHTSAGTALEQNKSALSQNPVSDWSIELWKTFANWIELVKLGKVSLETTAFRLYVTPKRSGKFVQLLSNANTDAEADNAISNIQSKFKKLKTTPACEPYIKTFLEFDEKKRRLLVRHFEFESEHDDPLDAIRSLLSATLSDSVIDTCCEYAIGNAKERVDALIRQGKAPVVNAGDFRKAFKAFVRRNDLSGILSSIAPVPEETEIRKTLLDSPVFVRQLVLVEMPQDIQVRAVSDYLQASANKTKWAEAGQIVRESLDDFEVDLKRAHRLIDLELESSNPTIEPKARGRALYSRCARINMTLESRDVPGFFIPGSYNDLANRLEIGWHPNFLEQFESK